MRLSDICAVVRIALLAMTLFALPHASAQGADAVELAWTAPAECPDADAVRARVRQLIGNAPPADGSAIRAVGTITRNERGEFELRLAIYDRGLVGERRIESRSCRDLAASAAVALALVVGGPEAKREIRSREAEGAGGGGTPSTSAPRPADPPPSTPAPEATPENVPESAPESEPVTAPEESTEADVPPPEPRRSRQLGLLLQAPVAALGFASLPRPSFGLGGGIGLLAGRFRVVAEAKGWLQSRLEGQRERAAYAIDVRRFTVGARGCFAFTWARFELAPCALLAVEHISGSGRGRYIAAQTARTTWVAPGVGAQARVHIAAWLRLLAGIDLQLNTARPTLAIDGVGRVEQLSRLGMITTLGAEWNL